MHHSLFNRLTVILCLVLSTRAYPSSEPVKACSSEEYSTLSGAIDTIICCLHLACPYCLVDPQRQVNRFRTAIDQNDTEVIEHVIRRRGFSPHQPLDREILPIIYAAKKAHFESVKKLLELGADVNSQLKDEFNSYPSALIAVSSTEDLPPERVAETVKVLLEHGADPSRTCIMFTESEKTFISKQLGELTEDSTEDQKNLIYLRIPQAWRKPRTALDFAIKHKYLLAISLIRQAKQIAQKKKVN